MKSISAILFVLFMTSTVFGFTSITPTTYGGKPISLAHAYYMARDVNVSGDTKLDINTVAWYNIVADGNWFAVPDEWSGYQCFSFYFYDKTTDPNHCQSDVNVYGANTYGCGKLVFSATVHAGNEQLSCNPVTGTAYLASTLADPNHKWANADGNFVSGADFGVVKSGNSGTTATGGILRYTVFGLDKFYRVEIRNITPADINRVHCIVTGGK